MSFWTLEAIRAAAGGSWVVRPERAHAPVAGVSIDSRTTRAGEAYLPIRGDRFDGHDFLADAAARGASMVFVERRSAAKAPPVQGSRVPIAHVPDARAALLRLSAEYRRTWNDVRVVAVTGSNGKTTTVRLIDAALSSAWRGVSSLKSFNNDIGVPLTLLRVREGDEYCVCEVGMNAPGEIAPLARAVSPDVAVITSIGRAHLQEFGSLEGIAKEKASLLEGLRAGGVAVIPAEERTLAPFVGGAPLMMFGAGAGADVRVANARHEGEGLAFDVAGSCGFTLPMLGLHNASNAAAAICVGRHFGLDDQRIARALSGASPPEMRLARRTIGGVEVINDAYNANPESTLAAIGTFAGSAGAPGATGSTTGRRALVLGDMREQGEFGAAMHEEVAEAILNLPAPGIDLVVAVGPLALHTARRLLRAWPAERVMTFSDADDGERGGADQIARLFRPGDRVLLKGSRGVGLERIESALVRLSAGAASAPPARRTAASAPNR